MKLMIYTLWLGLLIVLALAVVGCADEPPPTTLSFPTPTQTPPKVATTQVIIPATFAITPPINTPDPFSFRPTPVPPTFGEPENSATATVLNLPNPPVEIPLGKVPDDCSPPPLQPIAPARFAPGIGGKPIWIIHPGRFELFPSPTRYGYEYSVLLGIESNFTDSISLRGYHINDYSAMWFEVLDPRTQRPQQIPTLIPAELNLGSSDWRIFFTSFYFPSAGCYAIEAAWPGGSWRIQVAVGKKS